MEACNCCCQNEASPAIPEALLGCFDEPLVLTGECKRLLVTIAGSSPSSGSKRDTQLLIPTFDYCVPSKTCPPVGGTSTERSPCEVFSQIDFPMDAFFPGKNEPCIKPEDSCTGCSRTISNPPCLTAAGAQLSFVEASGRGRRLCGYR